MDITVDDPLIFMCLYAWLAFDLLGISAWWRSATHGTDTITTGLVWAAVILFLVTVWGCSMFVAGLGDEQ